MPDSALQFNELVDAGLFGRWADRADRADSSHYARQLRGKGWNRCS